MLQNPGCDTLAESHRVAADVRLALGVDRPSSSVVEEGIHVLREERGFLDVRGMATLFEYDEVRIRSPLQKLLGALKRSLRVDARTSPSRSAQ